MRRQRARQSQRQITDFFGLREIGEEGEARSQQPTQRATHTHTQGTLIDRAIELGNRDDHDRDAEAHFTGGDYSKGLEAF